MATSNAQANTTDQYRQSYQYSNTVDGLLKQVYIPALNNVTFHATPLMDMFGEYGGTIDFTGNKIIKAFKHQGAGGFGAIPEGGSFVAGRHQRGFQGYERLKFLNAFFSLTGPASRTVKSGQGAYVDAIASAMDDTLKLAQMQMERIIGGAGNGLLATFTSDGTDLTTSGVSVTLDTGTGGYSPAQFLSEGMSVDVCSDTSGTLVTNGDGATVSAVDYENGTCTITTASDTAELNATTYYLTCADAYGDIEAAGGETANSCLEPNGLTNLVDTSTYPIWNLTRATYPHALNSYVVAAGNEELDEELLITWMMDLINIHQSVPNVMVTDPRSRLKYFSNRKQDRRFDQTVIDTEFGFKSIGVTLDNYTLILQSLASLLPGTLFMLNTSAFKFARATQGFEWIDDGGRILRNKESSDAMFGTAVNYMNFVCEDPKGQMKATGISYS